MILITGKSTLASCLSERLEDSTVAGKPEYDFSILKDCDRLINDFPEPSILINTFGTLDDHWWNSITSNYVAPAYLTIEYYKKLSQGHIINISSMSSWWPSYPGISDSRLYYGLGKSNLSDFGKHFNRSTVDDKKPVIVTTIEPGRFQSKMSNNTGMNVDQIVDLVEFAISSGTNHISLIK